MTGTDALRLAKALKALGETFNEPVSDLRAEAYFFALEDFTIEQVEDAIRGAIKHCKFFPRPAELREQIGGSVEDQAELAWHELLAEIRRVGSWRPGELSPATQLTMERICGTWERCCTSIGHATGPELLGWAKRWKEGYGAHAGAISRGELMGREEAKQLLDGLTKRSGAQQLPSAYRGNLSALRPDKVTHGGDGDV